MLTTVCPKLPMRHQAITHDFYVNKLGFEEVASFEGYLIVRKDQIELHFFEFAELEPKENYGQIYLRTDNIEAWYQTALTQKIPIPQAGHLQNKPWGQKEFALLDPDHNLLTFGQSL